MSQKPKGSKGTSKKTPGFYFGLVRSLVCYAQGQYALGPGQVYPLHDSATGRTELDLILRRVVIGMFAEVRRTEDPKMPEVLPNLARRETDRGVPGPIDPRYSWESASYPDGCGFGIRDWQFQKKSLSAETLRSFAPGLPDHLPDEPYVPMPIPGSVGPLQLPLSWSDHIVAATNIYQHTQEVKMVAPRFWIPVPEGFRVEGVAGRCNVIEAKLMDMKAGEERDFILFDDGITFSASEEREGTPAPRPIACSAMAAEHWEEIGPEGVDALERGLSRFCSVFQHPEIYVEMPSFVWLLANELNAQRRREDLQNILQLELPDQHLLKSLKGAPIRIDQLPQLVDQGLVGWVPSYIEMADQDQVAHTLDADALVTVDFLRQMVG